MSVVGQPSNLPLRKGKNLWGRSSRRMRGRPIGRRGPLRTGTATAAARGLPCGFVPLPFFKGEAEGICIVKPLSLHGSPSNQRSTQRRNALSLIQGLPCR